MSSSVIVKRSIMIPRSGSQRGGHKTSLSVEMTFWSTFHEAADEKGMTLGQLAATIEHDPNYNPENLSSAVRMFCHDWQRKRAVEAAARIAGRGEPPQAYVGA